MDGHLAGPHAGERSCAGSLDPAEWRALRILGHRMLDDLFDDLEAVRKGPVWQPMPDDIRAAWQAPLPHSGADPVDVCADYRRLVAPYGVGNRHPRFFGWVHGGGTAIGMLAEMLAAGLNANCGGRDHAPIAVERQVVHWAAEMLGLPQKAGGLLLSGTSTANFVAVLAARRAALGPCSARGWRRGRPADGICVRRSTYVRRAGLGHGRPRIGVVAADSL